MDKRHTIRREPHALVSFAPLAAPAGSAGAIPGLGSAETLLLGIGLAHAALPDEGPPLLLPGADPIADTRPDLLAMLVRFACEQFPRRPGPAMRAGPRAIDQAGIDGLEALRAAGLGQLVLAYDAPQGGVERAAARVRQSGVGLTLVLGLTGPGDTHAHAAERGAALARWGASHAVIEDADAPSLVAFVEAFVATLGPGAGPGLTAARCRLSGPGLVDLGFAPTAELYLPRDRPAILATLA